MSANRDEMLAEESGELDPVEVVCAARVDCTIAPSGRYYGETWELGDIPLNHTVRYDMACCPVFQIGKVEMGLIKGNGELNAELQDLRHEIEDLEYHAGLATKDRASENAVMGAKGFMQDEWVHEGANDGHMGLNPNKRPPRPQQDAGYVARVIAEKEKSPKAASSPSAKGSPTARDRVLEAAAKASRRNAERMAQEQALEVHPLEP